MSNRLLGSGDESGAALLAGAGGGDAGGVTSPISVLGLGASLARETLTRLAAAIAGGRSAGGGGRSATAAEQRLVQKA